MKNITIALATAGVVAGGLIVGLASSPQAIPDFSYRGDFEAKLNQSEKAALSDLISKKATKGQLEVLKLKADDLWKMRIKNLEKML
jgi:hypothetical protein